MNYIFTGHRIQNSLWKNCKYSWHKKLRKRSYEPLIKRKCHNRPTLL